MILLTGLFLTFGPGLFAQELTAEKTQNSRQKQELQISEASSQKPSVSMVSDTLIGPAAVADTLVGEPEFLEDLVDYYGEDYVYMDQENAKVYLYNKAYMTYLDYRIDAGEIIMDYANNEVYARGIDSAGVYSQLPVFVQGNNKVQPDSIRFNFQTKKALVFNSRTAQNDINMLSQITKKENDSVYFLRNVKFTTSENVDDPEYYFYTRKAKFVPQKKVVTGLTNMYIADVPTPLGLPFAFFPLADTRASGFVIPNIGENNNRGFFLQNGGYYFAMNDYVDLTVLGDYYTNGSYGLRLDSDYALRYKFRGNLSVRYENLINSERGFPDFTQSSLYNIRWRHTQDPKVNPSTRFSASVNLGSSKYLQQSINQTNNASQLVNTLSSSVSYSKSFDTEPAIQFSAAATHSQNTQTEVINMSLPNINASISRIFPFAPKDGAKKGVFQNINLQYDVTAENRITTTDSLFFKPEMFQGAEAGARHSIPLGTNFKLFNYLSVSLGGNFQETWVGKTIRRSYDATLDGGLGGVVQDTVSGFDSYRTYGFSAGLGTTVYGTFNFGKDKKIQAIRHVLRPAVSYSMSPGFEQYYEEYTIPSADPEVNEEVRQYSRFENTIYGAPGKLYSSSMSFALSNTLEAKVRNPDTTATEPKKIALLNNFNLSTAYNITADSLNWSNVQFTGSIPIVKKLALNLNGSLDPYALNANNQRINTFNIDNGGSLFRLVNANMSFNYSFSSKDFDGSNKDQDEEDADQDFNNDTFRNGGRPDDLFGDGRDIADLRGDDLADNQEDQGDQKWYNNKIPWDFRLAYTITYGNQLRQNEISSNSLMMSSNISLSPRWRIGLSTGYDFKNKGVTLTQMRFERDLESWVMRFSWTPIGARNTSWNFFIGIRGSILRDIKYDKRREADRRL